MKDNNKLQLIVSEQGIDKSDVGKMVEAFGGPFEEAGEVLLTYKDIKVTETTDTAGMQKAREARLLLKKARTTVENKRKELKADIVKQGRAIDSVARFVKEEIEPAEQYLELQEKFAEIKLAEEKATLKAARIEQLSPLVDNISFYNFEAMTDEEFDNLITERKAALKAIEDKKLQDEADRLAKEKADEEARIAQAKENERLKAEAAERDRLQAIKDAELEKQEQARKDLLAKKEAEFKAEQQRIQNEADEKLAVERAERNKLEEANRQRELEAAQAKAKEEEKQREELLAPDKQKLIQFATGMDTIRTTRMPAVKSNDAQQILNQIEKRLLELSQYITEASKKL